MEKYIYFISCIVNFIGVIVVGLFAGIKSPDKELSKKFLLVTSALAWWSFSLGLNILAIEKSQALLSVKSLHLGAIFIPVFFLHFVIMFLELKDKEKLLRLIYSLASITAFLALFTPFFVTVTYRKQFGFYVATPKILYMMHGALLTYCLLYIFYLLLNVYKTAQPIKRNQIKYFFLALVIGYTGGLTNYLINYNIKIPYFYPLGNYTTFIYIGIIAYAIVRHQLMDIEVIIRKTLVFAGLLASVFAMLLIPTFIIQEYLTRGASFGGRALGLTISGIIIILALRRIESFLINVTDKYLFQKKYDYKELLKTFTSEVLTVLDLDRLVKLTVDKLSNIIKITSCGILLLNKEKAQYGLVASSGIDNKNIALGTDNTLAIFLARTKSYLSIKDQGKNSRLPARIVEDMNKLKLELAIPLIMHDEMIGVLTLGKKKSDEDYTQDDMDILLPLARTLSIAISNAEMFEELGKTQAEAAQQEKMAVIGTLSAGINHEICNPLGIARGQCEVFLLNLKDGLYKNKSQGELLEKARKIMEKVMHETDRATAITKRLSTFAKPSKGVISNDINIKDEIDEVLALVGYELKLDKVDIVKEIDKNLPFISADRKALEEVFFNLIRNAAQAIEGKGRITIRAKERNGKINIEIEDTGQGIPEGKIAEIFNPFYTTKDPGKGTGLGLFIVRQVVERNRGSISVRSKIGEGTTFSLEFPMGVKSGVRK